MRATELTAALAIREKLFLATKVWTRGKGSGIKSIERSLALLRTKRIDLMQVHNLVDVDTQLATLREWKQQGRIRYLGITHYDASAFADVEKIMRREKLDFIQVNYSLAEPEANRRLLQAATDSRIAVIVNRPFAEGAMFRQVKGKPLPDWAKDIGCASWAQFFLKWILANPAVTCAIPATRNPAHMADNMGAASGPLPDEATRRKMSAYFKAL